MSNRGWLLAAVLLVSGGPLGGQEGKESPIGAWVTNVDEPTGPGPPRNVQADSGDRQVRAHNRVGYGEPDSVAAAPADEPPKCTGPETKRLAENGSRQIGTYTCTDPGDAITWILKGAQADSLELRPLSPPQAARRTLAFRNIPNYELRSRYDAWVIGRDRGGLSDTVEVTVTVTDSLDEGVVNYDDDYAEENTAISDKTQPVRANVPGGPAVAAGHPRSPAGALEVDPGCHPRRGHRQLPGPRRCGPLVDRARARRGPGHHDHGSDQRHLVHLRGPRPQQRRRRGRRLGRGRAGRGARPGDPGRRSRRPAGGADLDGGGAQRGRGEAVPGTATAPRRDGRAATGTGSPARAPPGTRR